MVLLTQVDNARRTRTALDAGVDSGTGSSPTPCHEANARALFEREPFAGEVPRRMACRNASSTRRKKAKSSPDQVKVGTGNVSCPTKQRTWSLHLCRSQGSAKDEASAPVRINTTGAESTTLRAMRRCPLGGGFRHRRGVLPGRAAGYALVLGELRAPFSQKRLRPRHRRFVGGEVPNRTTSLRRRRRPEAGAGLLWW